MELSWPDRVAAANRRLRHTLQVACVAPAASAMCPWPTCLSCCRLACHPRQRACLVRAMHLRSTPLAPTTMLLLQGILHLLRNPAVLGQLGHGTVGRRALIAFPHCLHHACCAQARSVAAHSFRQKWSWLRSAFCLQADADRPMHTLHAVGAGGALGCQRCLGRSPFSSSQRCWPCRVPRRDPVHSAVCFNLRTPRTDSSPCITKLGALGPLEACTLLSFATRPPLRLPAPEGSRGGSDQSAAHAGPGTATERVGQTAGIALSSHALCCARKRSARCTSAKAVRQDVLLCAVLFSLLF